MGAEIDEPKLKAFAGALNAVDFSVQFLVRQHPPRLDGLRSALDEAQPDDLPEQGVEAARSLRDLLARLENRDGILDRRFCTVCVQERADELRSLLARTGMSVHPLDDRRIRMFFLSAVLGGAPTEFDEEASVSVEIGRRDIRLDGRPARSLHLGRWPRSLSPGFLQALMVTGIAIDLAVHLSPIPAEQAARTLEWQKVRFESARSLSMQHGRSLSPEAEITLKDVMRLRNEVQRGRGRLFNASLSVTLHAHDLDSLKEMTQRVRAHFGIEPRQDRPPHLPSAGGAPVHTPYRAERHRVVENPRHLVAGEALSVLAARPRHAQGRPVRIDMRSGSPVVYDPFDREFLNANTAVLARSGSGKSFSTKLAVLRGVTRGVTAYVIDPEGEYADMAQASGGRVLSPGVPGQGMNPFVIQTDDPEELLQRIGSLRRLVEVMIGERMSAASRASLDHALAGYYAEQRGRTGFRDFHEYLKGS